ncbi:hypothetical protein BV25DRAFT_154403 [Artomyces pyxidatus]|uniref:Uncharacterized protein n=1 Tax=Artomyces pyxidatus TaxID=48021 RepID=A0ACB8TAC3_9AGAM|nr:hypothetical protein BV25DRAFT_154403 [Artomyces pyxidatus]
MNTETCTHCTRNPPDLKRCTRCRLARYCYNIQGPNCQNAAWSVHKRVCRPPPSDLPTTPPSARVDGVRLLARHNTPFLPEAVTVSPEHVVWTTGHTSPISQLIGVPLLFHRELREWDVDAGNDPARDNQSVTYMMITPEIGFAPPRWLKNIGPVTVVRADQKPLTLLELEKIWMFCDRILSMFEDNQGPPFNMYYPERYQEFSEEYRD